MATTTEQKPKDETYIKLLLAHQYDVWIGEVTKAGNAGGMFLTRQNIIKKNL